MAAMSSRYEFKPENGLCRLGCRLARCVAGSAPVEYVLMLVFFAIVALTGIVTLANTLSNQLTTSPFGSGSGELREVEPPAPVVAPREQL